MKNIPVICLLCIVLFTIVWPVGAAEISVVEFGDSYRAKITGVIEPGDHDRLVAMVREKDDFPDAVQFDSVGGDVDESIAIGRFARQMMLATATGRNCDGACFLAWAGGVHRKARESMDIHVPITEPAQVDLARAYLADMEVPDDVIDKALGTTSTPMTPAQIIAAVGVNSIRHERWLAEQCGTLTSQQEKDWQAIQALKSMEDSLNNMGMAAGGQAMYNVDAGTQEQAARAQTFSAAHRDSVTQSRAKIKTCQNNVIAAARSL